MLRNKNFNNNTLFLPTLAILGLIFLGVIPFVITPRLSYAFYLMFWMVMASSFNIIYGFTGYLPFGYVAFYGVGAYTTAILWSRLGVPIPIAVLGGGFIGVLLSLIFAPTLRLQGVYFAIVNLSCAMALRIVVSNLPEEWTGGSLGVSLSSVYKPLYSYYLMLSLLVITVYVSYYVSKSRFGIALRCIREDPDAAEVLGVNVVRNRLKAWILAALFSSFAGGIEAWHTAIIDPDSSFNLLITTKTIIYAMFGGLGTIIGPIVGSISLYVLDDLIWGKFPLLNMLILGAMVVILVIFFPRGIIGSLTRKYPSSRRYVR
ncbi:MAG: branched-chain amino acid ABC transporter permease [Deltaproteobacteria bacterium]|nr:MAG: branched-chain amino acid ABC transporter permease [Deltaproteobacteria bacterium]